MPCGRRAKHSREFWCKHLSHGDTSWDDMVKFTEIVFGTKGLLVKC